MRMMMMMMMNISALLLSAAQAQVYPVVGKWGQRKKAPSTAPECV